jgi:hypothetical protein
VDDLREIMAYYRLQAQDHAYEQWKAKMEQLHAQRAKGHVGGSMTGS